MHGTDQRFRRAVEFVLEHETVYKPGHWGQPGFETYECDGDDPGGLTKFGIDQRSHPGLNIKALTRERAIEIYAHEYWTPVRASELPDGFAEVCFDIAVNNGRGQAVMLLQRACQQTAAPALVVDAHIGPKTIAAAREAGVDGVRRLLELRHGFYRQLAADKPRMHKYLRGWLNRNCDLANLVGVTSPLVQRLV